jgi:hypothetical protein
MYAPSQRAGSAFRILAQQSLSKLGLSKNLSKLPLTFEVNRGQANSAIDFLARTQKYELLFKPTEFCYPSAPEEIGKEFIPRFQSTVVRMQFVRANRDANIVGQEKSGAMANYFIGNDPQKWRTGIPSYRTLRVHALYDGIDLMYYGKDNELEHDLVVAPGKDASVITMFFPEATSMKTDGDGDLVVGLTEGEFHLKRPKIYQELEASSVEIEGGYTLKGTNQVGFYIGKHNESEPLIIDPVLDFSTYLGGNSGDGIESVAVDSNGNIYVVGATSSTNFPLKNPFQSSVSPNGNGFISKFDPTGTSLIYSTYFGGTGVEPSVPT